MSLAKLRGLSAVSNRSQGSDPSFQVGITMPLLIADLKPQHRYKACQVSSMTSSRLMSKSRSYSNDVNLGTKAKNNAICFNVDCIKSARKQVFGPFSIPNQPLCNKKRAHLRQTASSCPTDKPNARDVSRTLTSFSKHCTHAAL